MNKLTKKQLLIGGLILLFVINIAALGTIIYQNQKYKAPAEEEEYSERSWNESRKGKREKDFRHKGHKDDGYEKKRGNRFDHFIKDELNFDEDQFSKFLDIREKNKEKQHNIVRKLSQKREKMMNELSTENPDTTKLRQIAKQIGNLHEELKKGTIEHFIQVKSICNPSQKGKFNKLIKKMEKHKKHRHRPDRNHESDQDHGSKLRYNSECNQ